MRSVKLLLDTHAFHCAQFLCLRLQYRLITNSRFLSQDAADIAVAHLKLNRRVSVFLHRFPGPFNSKTKTLAKIQILHNFGQIAVAVGNQPRHPKIVNRNFTKRATGAINLDSVYDCTNKNGWERCFPRNGGAGWHCTKSA